MDIVNLLQAYAATIGWAITAGIAMGLGTLITLKVFTFLTKEVDEWELIQKNNISIAIILAAVVLGTSLVVMNLVRP
jgi:uncharacterized membrane protein YjfL (UPF0719 family)